MFHTLGRVSLVASLTLVLCGCEQKTLPAGAPAAPPSGAAATASASESAPSEARTPAATQPAAILCPVTGKPIDRHYAEQFRGRWVYFANQAALDEFTRDPYRFADAVKAQWNVDEPLRVQVHCPVTGEPPKPDIFVGRGLDAVYFATEDAKAKYVADPAQFADKLTDCYTYQTLCAHSGMDIDPQVTLDFKGRTLYFFCENCRAAFEKEPAAEQAHLLQQVDAQIAAHRAAWEKRHQP